VYAIDLVIRSHDRCRVAAPCREHERQEIDLPQRTWSDNGIHRHSLMFLIVANKVLDSSAYVLVLEAIDVACCKHAGQERVLGVRLESSTAQWPSLDVNRWPEDNMGSLCSSLIAE
jgi:hypothetical protein